MNFKAVMPSGSSESEEYSLPYVDAVRYFQECVVNLHYNGISTKAYITQFGPYAAAVIVPDKGCALNTFTLDGDQFIISPYMPRSKWWVSHSAGKGTYVQRLTHHKTFKRSFCLNETHKTIQGLRLDNSFDFILRPNNAAIIDKIKGKLVSYNLKGVNYDIYIPLTDKVALQATSIDNGVFYIYYETKNIGKGPFEEISAYKDIKHFITSETFKNIIFGGDDEDI